MRQTVAFVLVLLAVAQATSVEDAGRYCSVLSQDNCESLFNICQWNATEAVCDAAVMRTLVDASASASATAVDSSTLIGADAAAAGVAALTTAQVALALTITGASDSTALIAKISAMTMASGDDLIYQVMIKEWATASSGEIETAFAALDSNEQADVRAGLKLASDASAAAVAAAVKGLSASSTTATTSNGYIMGSLVVLLAIIQ